jgi:hypothetical protein
MVNMLFLTDYLRKQLKISISQLDELVQNDHERLRNMLQGLPLFTGHEEKPQHLAFDGISQKPLREIHVNNGGVETSMEQFLYSKYGLTVRKPDYPCLIHRTGIFGLDSYYPLEFIYTETK